MAEPLAHVLWIGGGCGSGKTSIGLRLAHGHDLRSYNADAHTWEHHFRSLADGDPAGTRWESLAPDERWLTMGPEEMAAFSLELNAERFRHMVDDVRTLPRSPLVVVEGTPLLPWLVQPYLASREHAVWLIPSPGFQRARLRERPTTSFAATSDLDRAQANRIERERRVAEAIERGAEVRGFTVSRVDEARDLAAVQAAVEETLGRVLERGPRAATEVERRAMRRAENGTVLQQLRTYLEQEPLAGTPDSFAFPFSCECGASGCGAQPVVTVGQYARLVERGDLLRSHAAERVGT